MAAQANEELNKLNRKSFLFYRKLFANNGKLMLICLEL